MYLLTKIHYYYKVVYDDKRLEIKNNLRYLSD